MFLPEQIKGIIIIIIIITVNIVVRYLGVIRETGSMGVEVTELSTNKQHTHTLSRMVRDTWETGSMIACTGKVT